MQQIKIKPKTMKIAKITFELCILTIIFGVIYILDYFLNSIDVGIVIASIVITRIYCKKVFLHLDEVIKTKHQNESKPIKEIVEDLYKKDLEDDKITCSYCDHTWYKYQKDVGMNVYECEKCGGI